MQLQQDDDASVWMLDDLDKSCYKRDKIMF